MIDFKISTFNEIFSFSSGEKYIELTNTVGQQWYIPYENSKLFLSLFQPSSFKGKIISKIFNIIKHLPFVLRLIHAQITYIKFTPQFEDFIYGIFKRKDCQIGIFCGSPGHYQKITLMIGQKNIVLGYCKLSDKDEIGELFKKESENLAYLHRTGIDNVPVSLYCNRLKYCNIYAFVQNSKRTNKISIANSSCNELIDFVCDLLQRTALSIQFEDTDFAVCLKRLSKNLYLLKSPEIEKRFAQGIKTVYKNKKTFSVFSSSHGDLTAWNSFIVDGHLFAFDLEYFKRSYPPLCDYFHFFTQDLVYNQNANAEQIYNQYQKTKHLFSGFKSIDLLYLSYVLIVAEFYLYRDKGVLNDRLGQCFQIWSCLAHKLTNDVEKNN